MRLKSTWIVAAVLLVIASGASAADEAPAKNELLFTFIGNEAFTITDGNMTLASDFPYKSGAFGYMRYKFDEVKTVGEVVCLFTHVHDDHFDITKFRSTGFTMIAPVEMTRMLPGYRCFPIDDELDYEGLHIQAFITPHTPEHHSYVVTWHGVRMFFAGDTELAGSVLGVDDLDVAFVSPWLLAKVESMGEKIDAKKIVIYHHNSGDQIESKENPVIPRQGDTFTIPFRESE